MTQEEKQLLLKDLCARLPYGVKVQYKDFDPINLESIDQFTVNGNYLILLCKPYLRPMSSMTNEARKEFDEYTFEVISFFGLAVEARQLTDWLNAHHFDYRGLIEMGLALPAPEGIYN